MNLQNNSINLQESYSITFRCGDINMIKLEPNGDIFVKDKLIENDIEVVETLRKFLNYHNFL